MFIGLQSNGLFQLYLELPRTEHKTFCLQSWCLLHRKGTALFLAPSIRSSSPYCFSHFNVRTFLLMWKSSAIVTDRSKRKVQSICVSHHFQLDFRPESLKDKMVCTRLLGNECFLVGQLMALLPLREHEHWRKNGLLSLLRFQMISDNFN